LGHRPMPPPSGYNVEVTSLATDGRTSRDYSRVTGSRKLSVLIPEICVRQWDRIKAPVEATQKSCAAMSNRRTFARR